MFDINLVHKVKDGLERLDLRSHQAQEIQTAAAVMLPSCPSHTQEPSSQRIGLNDLPLELREMIYYLAIKDEPAVIEYDPWKPIDTCYKPTTLHHLVALGGPVAEEVKRVALAETNWIFRSIHSVAWFVSIEMQRSPENNTAKRLKHLTIQFDHGYEGDARDHRYWYGAYDILGELDLHSLTFVVYMGFKYNDLVPEDDTAKAFTMREWLSHYHIGLKADAQTDILFFERSDDDEDQNWYPYDRTVEAKRSDYFLNDLACYYADVGESELDTSDDENRQGPDM